MVMNFNATVNWNLINQNSRLLQPCYNLGYNVVTMFSVKFM